MKRTHNCGELRKEDVSKVVVLKGWCNSRRDHGGVIFIDLRDRWGLTQVVFDPSHNKEIHKVAEHIGREFVLEVKGKVRSRKEGMINTKLATGEIEALVDELQILNEAETPPIEIEDRKEANEELRMRYRYLDLRRPKMQKHMIVRHLAAQAAREYLNKQGFIEIETPMLIRSTPEGARDYIVPSRVNMGCIYSLPQSPQLYKQILMVAGFDRYYQLAKCLRDEDLRSDRQPEFTQIDLEMSFVDEKDVQDVVEGVMKSIFKKTLNMTIKTPFPRLTYDEAISKFGSDKPDLRFGLEIIDLSDILKNSEFTIFRDIIKHGGQVKCINVEGGASWSRKEIEKLEDSAKIYKAKGLSWAKIINNKFESQLAKHLKEEEQKQVIKKAKAKNNDLLLIVADKPKIAAESLGQLRLKLGEKLKLIKEGEFKFCWVTDFPLFEWSDDEEKWVPMHHIFSMPKQEHIKYLETDPGKVKGKLYDLTLNGTEIWGGSIRIHRKEIQQKVLKVIGMKYDEAEKRFGFLLNSFKYGAPPHGGIAAGFDRIVALICGYNDIREVIAFPKNKNAQCLMDGCPSQATDEDLKEVHLNWAFETEPKTDHKKKKKFGMQ